MTSTAEAVDFTVSNTDDLGPGSLRQALTDSNNDNSPTVDRILFQSGLTGTIGLASPLPGIDEPLQVLGPGANVLMVSGNNARRSFASMNTAAGDDVLISGLTLTAGNSGGNVGGAILSDDADLTLQSMNISGNTSGDEGGGVFQSAGSVTILNSTISGNDALGATAFGGGLYTNATAMATVQNSTISGNSSERGGGMYLNGSPTIQNTTISNNTAHFGGGVYEEFGAPIPTFTNTLIADNGVAGIGAAGPDLLNSFNASFTLVEQTSGANVTETVAGSNITDDVSDGTNDVDPQLGALGPNGGPTETHALPQTSLAVDKGSSAGPTDQRGQPRPSDFASIPNSMAVGANGADMGAFELQVPQAVQPPTALLPLSNDIGFGKVKRNTKKGTAILTVTLPAPGEISLGGNGIAQISLASASRQVAAGPVELKLKPAKGKSGRKVRRSLRQKGKATVQAQVTFVPTGGTANTETTKVKLIKR